MHNTCRSESLHSIPHSNENPRALPAFDLNQCLPPLAPVVMVSLEP